MTTTRQFVPREAWLAARDELLEREKEHTRLGDELARRRRELPWVAVEKPYTLQTPDGPKDSFDGLIPHLNARDTSLIAVSGAPIEKLHAYAERMGFALEDGAVYHAATGRGIRLEFLMPYYAFLDRAPNGRDEGEDWQMWIRRRDEYGAA